MTKAISRTATLLLPILLLASGSVISQPQPLPEIVQPVAAAARYAITINNFQVGELSLSLEPSSMQSVPWIRSSTLTVSGLARSFIKYNFTEQARLDYQNGSLQLLSYEVISIDRSGNPAGDTVTVTRTKHGTFEINTSRIKDGKPHVLSKSIPIPDNPVYDENTWFFQVGIDYQADPKQFPKPYHFISHKGEIATATVSILGPTNKPAVCVENSCLQIEKIIGNKKTLLTLDQAQKYLPVRVQQFKKGRLKSEYTLR